MAPLHLPLFNLCCLIGSISLVLVLCTKRIQPAKFPFGVRQAVCEFVFRKSRMADYNTLLRTVREKENLVGQARNDVEAAHQALIANRDTPPSKRTALHNAILEHGLASAQIIAHRQSPEYASAKVELAERQKDVENVSNRGVPTKRYLDLRYMASAQKEPDVPIAGPILTGPAVPHVPQADTNQSFLAEVYEEVGSESFSAG